MLKLLGELVTRRITVRTGENIEPGTQAILYVELRDNQGKSLLVKPVTVKVPDVRVSFWTTNIVFNKVGDGTKLEVVVHNLEKHNALQRCDPRLYRQRCRITNVKDG